MPDETIAIAPEGETATEPQHAPLATPAATMPAPIQPDGSPSDAAEAVRALQKHVGEEVAYWGKLYDACDDIRSSDVEVRRLKWIVQAVVKHLRDDVQKVGTAIEASK